MESIRRWNERQLRLKREAKERQHAQELELVEAWGRWAAWAAAGAWLLGWLGGGGGRCHACPPDAWWPNVLLRTCRRLEALRQEEAEEAAELRGRNKQVRSER